MHTSIRGPLAGWKLFDNELHLKIQPPRWAFAISNQGWFDPPHVGIRLKLGAIPLVVDKTIKLESVADVEEFFKAVGTDGRVEVTASGRIDAGLDEVSMSVTFEPNRVPYSARYAHFIIVDDPVKEGEHELPVVTFGDFRRYYKRPGVKVDNRGVTFRNGGADWVIEGAFDLIDGAGKSCGSDVCAFNCDTGEVTWHVLDDAGLPKLTPERDRIETASALRPLPFTVKADGLTVAPHESAKAYLKEMPERRRAEWLHPSPKWRSVGDTRPRHGLKLDGLISETKKVTGDPKEMDFGITVNIDAKKVVEDVGEKIAEMFKDVRKATPVILSNAFTLSRADIEEIKIGDTGQRVVLDGRLESISVVASDHVPPGFAIIDPQKYLPSYRPPLEPVGEQWDGSVAPINGVEYTPEERTPLDQDKIAAALGAADRITVEEAMRLAAEGKTWDGFDVSPLVVGLKAIKTSEAIDKSQADAFRNGYLPGQREQNTPTMYDEESLSVEDCEAFVNGIFAIRDKKLKAVKPDGPITGVQFTPGEDDDVQPSAVVEG